jgi:hypothetical protein
MWLVVGALALSISRATAGDFTCFDSADAVRRQHLGAWPSWTLRALGHEGRKCWYASTRGSAHDHGPAVARSTAKAMEPIEQPAATVGFDTGYQAKSPSTWIAEERFRSAWVTGARPADEAEGTPVAAPNVSERVSDPATPSDDRPLARDANRPNAGADAEPVSGQQFYTLQSAPTENEHLPVRAVLVIIAGALVLASIAARIAVKSWDVLRM